MSRARGRVVITANAEDSTLTIELGADTSAGVAADIVKHLARQYGEDWRQQFEGFRAIVGALQADAPPAPMPTVPDVKPIKGTFSAAMGPENAAMMYCRHCKIVTTLSAAAHADGAGHEVERLLRLYYPTPAQERRMHGGMASGDA